MRQAAGAPVERVLVIDDDALMRELLALLLGAEGCAVVTAESGEAALALLELLPEGERPQVVLTDLKMPGVSHAALAVALRVTCPPPCVVMAMSASEPDAEVSAYDSFLLKPFTVQEYGAGVKAGRLRSRPVTKPAPTRLLRTRVLTADTEEAAGRRVLNHEVYDKMAAVMGEDELPPLYTMFMEDAAMRAEKMRVAVGGNDAVTFTREAHAIKGGCGMLGATELYSLARRMETGGLSCASLLQDFQPALDRLQRILDQRGTKTP